MADKNFYDVTEWKNGDTYSDIGRVINSIISDIKRKQANADVSDGGKPGYFSGGSRILVDLDPLEDDEASGAAFYVKRDGNPRISSVEFENFCIDGLHFLDDGSGNPNPENTYTNGKNSSCR